MTCLPRRFGHPEVARWQSLACSALTTHQILGLFIWVTSPGNKDHCRHTGRKSWNWQGPGNCLKWQSRPAGPWGIRVQVVWDTGAYQCGSRMMKPHRHQDEPTVLLGFTWFLVATIDAHFWRLKKEGVGSASWRHLKQELSARALACALLVLWRGLPGRPCYPRSSRPVSIFFTLQWAPHITIHYMQKQT